MTNELAELKLEKGTQISVEFQGMMPTAYNVDGSISNTFPLWPAFWLMGTGIWNDSENQPWPYCGEIDIMEWAPIKGLANYSNAIHWEESGTTPYVRNYSSTTINTNNDLRNNFHKYKTIISRTLSDEVKIKMYFDGIFKNEYIVNDSTKTEFFKTITKDGEEIADYKYYGLLMNLALGGDYGGPLNDNIDEVDRNFNEAVLKIRSITINKTST